TQLTMRTFHIGGAAQLAESSVMESAHDGSIRLVDRNTVKNAQGDLIVMSRNMKISVVDEDGKERQSFKPPFGARLKVDEKSKIKRGDRIAEWDPYATPILTEVAGKVRFEDLTEGVAVRDEFDEATGISSKVVIDWRSTTKGSDLKPSISVLNAKGVATKTYSLPVGAILSVADGDEVTPGQDLARMPTG